MVLKGDPTSQVELVFQRGYTRNSRRVLPAVAAGLSLLFAVHAITVGCTQKSFDLFASGQVTSWWVPRALTHGLLWLGFALLLGVSSMPVLLLVAAVGGMQVLTEAQKSGYAVSASALLAAGLALGVSFSAQGSHTNLQLVVVGLAALFLVYRVVLAGFKGAAGTSPYGNVALFTGELAADGVACAVFSATVLAKVYSSSG